MSGEVLLTCEHVSKKFCRGLKRSLWYGLQDICGEMNPLSNIQHKSKENYHPYARLRKDEFWAVFDISFKLRRGECLGLIGHNGAGKSTLLKMLNGLIKPDHGKITAKGRVGALIELNAGFNPILTGKENVYIYGTILGLTKKEITQKYNEIIDFADMHDFMNMPVKSYSSGMKMRLGFAIATSVQPDILLIDEVLAVGDISFRAKCFERIQNYRNSGTGIVFVSHEMSLIDKISDEVLLLLKNSKYKLDDSATIIEEFNKSQSFSISNGHKHDHPSINVVSVNIYGDSANKIIPGGPLTIEINYSCSEEIICYPSISFHKGYGEQIAACRTDRDAIGLVKLCPPSGKVTLKLENQPFTAGFYSISVRLFSTDSVIPLLDHYVAYPFLVNGGCNTVGHIHFNYKWNFV